jgi:predicted transcriptional regulator
MVPASWLFMFFDSGYTAGMKTAVSLPNELFARADRLAKRLDVSRSELYGRALREYLARHSADEVTQALDQLCEELDTGSDDFVREAGRRIFEATEW